MHYYGCPVALLCCAYQTIMRTPICSMLIREYSIDVGKLVFCLFLVGSLQRKLYDFIHGIFFLRHVWLFSRWTWVSDIESTALAALYNESYFRTWLSIIKLTSNMSTLPKSRICQRPNMIDIHIKFAGIGALKSHCHSVRLPLHRNRYWMQLDI